MGPERRGDLDAIDIMRNYMDFHSSGNYELGISSSFGEISLNLELSYLFLYKICHETCTVITIVFHKSPTAPWKLCHT